METAEWLFIFWILWFVPAFAINCVQLLYLYLYQEHIGEFYKHIMKHSVLYVQRNFMKILPHKMVGCTMIMKLMNLWKTQH